MGLLRRRLPVYARPAPAILGGLLAVVGLSWGLGWDWNWSLQTGNVFLLLLVPQSFVHPGVGRWFALALGLVGLFALSGIGLQGRLSLERDLRASAGGWRRARFRIFPATFLLGLFLLAFAFVFLFDASVYGDVAPGGYAAFVYLDYAGLFDRPVGTTIGALLLAAGMVCTTTLAFERGLGLDFEVPVVAPAANAERPRPEPTPAIVPRTPRSVLAARVPSSGPARTVLERPASSPRRVLNARVPPTSVSRGLDETNAREP